MKKGKKLLLFALLLLAEFAIAQVGINTATPDESSVLDVYSTNKGFLMPRLTTIQRDEILNPSDGLMVYNTTTSSLNYFNSVWKNIAPSYNTINDTGIISTSSATDITVPGMVLALPEGSYYVAFDSQISNLSVPITVNSNTLLTDFFILYNQLQSAPVTNATHTAAFGSGETVVSGKYSVASAISIAGILTLDGGGDSNAVFIFYANGAIDFGANTTIVLTNGASAENIFWLAEGAVGVGADTIVYGNLISHGAAVAVGANCTVNGRMMTNAGAVSFGPGSCNVPLNPSAAINMGSLSTFVLFTGAGAINNTGSSVYNGNICSGAGAIGSLTTATVNGITVLPNVDTIINNVTVNALATFSICQNGILIPSSSKQITCNNGYTNLSLHAIANVSDGELITIQWKIDSGILALGNRVLTSIMVH
nr:ice-binding family protein [uncultured Flavobacterium sp.]